MLIEVVWIGAGVEALKTLELSPKASVLEALGHPAIAALTAAWREQSYAPGWVPNAPDPTQSSLPKSAPTQGARLGLAIWNRLCRLDTVLREGDRLELLRPLTADPKVVRRARVALQRAAADRTRWRPGARQPGRPRSV